MYFRDKGEKLSLKVSTHIKKNDRLRYLTALEFCIEHGICGSEYDFVRKAVLSQVKDVEKEMKRKVESKRQDSERVGDLEKGDRPEHEGLSKQTKFSIFPDQRPEQVNETSGKET